MSAASRPCLDPSDDLTAAVDIDLNLALADLQRQRIESPIIGLNRLL